MSHPLPTDLHPFASFSEASTAVLHYLHEQLPFDLWMITRTEGEDWIVLNAFDHGYNVSAGRVFRWADSFCSRMVTGEGPRVAPQAHLVATYADAPIAKQVNIGSYFGVPMTKRDGSLFGTLCAIHPQPQNDSIREHLPLVELMTRLLSTCLHNELEAQQQSRRAERAEADSLTDSLTGLYNRRGWDLLTAAEESRCRRYGHPACVVSIDLDGLKQANDLEGHAVGDRMLIKMAEALRSATRTPDVCARMGGDEFAVLAVECDQDGGEVLEHRIRTACAAAGVQASIGVAVRHPTHDIQHALIESDHAMYAAKRMRRLAT